MNRWIGRVIFFYILFVWINCGYASQNSHILEGTFNINFFHYEEDFPGADKETERGILFPAAHASYTYVGQDNFLFARFLGEWSNSKTTYRNAFGEKGESKNRFFDVEADLGFGYPSKEVPKKIGFPFEGLQILYMYMGVGYQMWKREIGNTATNNGYEAEYKRWYFPLGLRGFFYISDGLSGNMDVALMLNLPTNINAKFSQRSASFVDVKTTIETPGVSVKIELGLDYELFPHFFLTFSMRYEYIFIDEGNRFVFATDGSKTTYPGSETHTLLFRFGAKIAF